MTQQDKPDLDHLVARVRACRLCEDQLPLGPRPVVQVSASARILVAGQAPGTRVHETGLPFNDPSGDRLREWMGIDRDVFYDDQVLAIIPMGFCYPGRGKSGDLPPLPLCADTWRSDLLDRLPNLKLTLAIGQYAQRWHLADRARTLTETVRNWETYGADIMPLPHPSPRNNIWLRKNGWFERDLVPVLRQRVSDALAA